MYISWSFMNPFRVLCVFCVNLNYFFNMKSPTDSWFQVASLRSSFSLWLSRHGFDTYMTVFGSWYVIEECARNLFSLRTICQNCRIVLNSEQSQDSFLPYVVH
ncbi:hypothetical protein EG68_00575 [Paragonimus skrjabini miyazakii]|uniref:Uncharacterized protein n=1 Tax=Paragonimus skrjabini miyazakii TaxID=59628 RepID=A0A8S9Z929_9TREM|nr:hypothetical protein EG68_00575 [Paragonimus skrjabini miyazakii]